MFMYLYCFTRMTVKKALTDWIVCWEGLRKVTIRTEIYLYVLLSGRSSQFDYLVIESFKNNEKLE